MNSTDEQKKAIIAMFEEPINEVQTAFNIVVKGLSDMGLDMKLPYLQQKITNLKARLPTIQE